MGKRLITPPRQALKRNKLKTCATAKVDEAGSTSAAEKMGRTVKQKMVSIVDNERCHQSLIKDNLL